MKKIFSVFLSFCLILASSSLKINSSFAEEVLKTIAILDFENNTGFSAQDNLKKALSDSLTINLAKYKSLSIVERTRLKDAVSEVTLSQSTFVSADNAIKIGKTLGAEYVLLGSISKIGEIFEVSERIVQVETSKIIDAKSIRCSKADAILKGIDYLSLEIAKAFGESIENQELINAKKAVEYANNPELFLTKKEEPVEKKETKPEENIIVISKEQIQNTNQQQTQVSTNPVSIVVKKEDLEKTKSEENEKKKETISNNNWIWWVAGGVVIAGGVTAAILLTRKNTTTTTQPKPIVKPIIRDTTVKKYNFNEYEQINIFNFSF